MAGLETLIRKGIDKYRTYRQIANATIIAIPMLAFIGYAAFEFATQCPKFAMEIRKARNSGATIEKHHEGNGLKEDFYNSATIKYPNSDETIKVSILSKSPQYYPYWLAWTFGFYAFYFYSKRENKGIKFEYNLGERIRNLASRTIYTTSLGAITYAGTSILYDFARIETAVVAGLSVWMSNKLKQERKTLVIRAKLAREEGRLRDKFYLLDEIGNLSEEARASLKKDDLTASCIALYRQAKAIRELRETNTDFTHQKDAYGNFAHFIQRHKARRHKSPENDLKLIAMVPTHLEIARRNDLAEIIERNAEMSLEFMLLDYEMTTDKKSREQKGIQIYEKLEASGKIRKLSNRTNSLVAVAHCGVLGNKYVIKEDSAMNISDEARQTIATREGFLADGVADIDVAEVSQVYLPGTLKDLSNNGRLMIAFEEGESLQEYLHRRGSSQAIGLLIKHAIANMKSTKYGISASEEDRLAKTIDNLSTNRWIAKETADIIMDEIHHCFELTKDIPQLYDRDGNPGNSIIGQHGVTLIDFPARRKSLPLYCLVKQLEHTGLLGYDREGFAMRVEVVSEGMKAISLFNSSTIAAYFGICITKFVSYTAFAYEKEDTDRAARAYKDGALFGIDVVLSDFRGYYSQEAINGFVKMRDALSAETLQRSRN